MSRCVTCSDQGAYNASLESHFDSSSGLTSIFIVQCKTTKEVTITLEVLAAASPAEALPARYTFQRHASISVANNIDGIVIFD